MRNKLRKLLSLALALLVQVLPAITAGSERAEAAAPAGVDEREDATVAENAGAAVSTVLS